MPFTSDNTKTSLIFSIYIMNGYRKPSASHFLHITSTMTLGHFIYLRLHFIRRPTVRLLFALPFPCNNAPLSASCRLHFSLLSFEKMRVEGNRWREKFIHSFIDDIILFDWKKSTNNRNCDICKKNMTAVVVNVAFQFVIDVMKDDKWIVKGRLQAALPLSPSTLSMPKVNY